jgi:hypothetical protein
MNEKTRETKHDEYIAAMYGDHNESSVVGLDIAAIAEAFLARYSSRVYPRSADCLSTDTRSNQLISSEVCASLLVRNGGDFGAAAIALPGALARALRRLDHSPIELECNTDGVSKLRELVRVL